MEEYVNALIDMDIFPTRDIDNVKYYMKLSDEEGVREAVNTMLRDHIRETVSELETLLDEVEFCGITSDHVEAFKYIMSIIPWTTDTIQRNMEVFNLRPGNDEFYAVYTPTMNMLKAKMTTFV
jgi:hypothetical protein